MISVFRFILNALRLTPGWLLLVSGAAWAFGALWYGMMYERHVIATRGLLFAELKQRSHINPAARAADQDSAFSDRIREGLPVPTAGAVQ